MMWAGIMNNGRTPLHNFEQGILTSQWYCRGIIMEHVHLFRHTVGPDFPFMEDNACPHRIVTELNTLRKGKYWTYGMACLLLRLKSYRACLGCSWQTCFSKKSPCARTVQTLENTLREEWDNISQGLFSSLVDSMNNWCKVCSGIRGGHTSYLETDISHPFIWKDLSCDSKIFQRRHFFIFLLSLFPMWCDLYHSAW